MPRQKPLVIGGQHILPGETCELRLRYGETYLGAPESAPVYVLRAAKRGPRLFLAGAIHGDELSSMGIVRQLLYDKPPQLVKGTLICLPVVNLYGLEHHTRYMADRRDLNRCFPGSPQGSLAGRLANAIFTEVVRQCDYGIDFHSASVRRTNYPNIRADVRNTQTKTLARAFGCELIVKGRGPKGSLRRSATESGVPTISLEAGEVWKIERGVLEIGVRGCLNVMKGLGMVQGEPDPPAFQVTVNKTTWVRADQGGILGFNAGPGQLVRKGECLATCYSVFGRERTGIESPADGIILGVTTMPAVKPGGPVFHLAVLPKGTLAQVAQKLAERPHADPHSQIRNALAGAIAMEMS